MRASSKAKPFQQLSEAEQERVIHEIVNGNERTLADKSRFLALRDEYFAQAMIAHGVDRADFDNPNVELAADVKPAASFFNPEWLVGLNLLDPYSERMLKRVYRPRQIGVVTNSMTADPSSFDGPDVGWKAFLGPDNEGELTTDPRLAFVQSWGSGPNQLYGTVVATHYRQRHAITWLAVRRVVPSSDPATRPSGEDVTLYEVMLRNARWVSMIVASYDPVGDSLIGPQGNTGDVEEMIRVHLNDDGRYRQVTYASSVIDGWQRRIMSQSPAVPADPYDTTLLTMTAEEAERRYYQLVMALHMARASDNAFDELVNAASGVRVLLNERVPNDEAQRKYLPVYNGGDVSLSRQQQALNRARPFTF